MNRYIFIFFLCSCCGWIWESIYCNLLEHRWANRGFLWGPVCPVYGFGALCGLAVNDLCAAGILPHPTWYAVFICGFFVSMLLEYPTSWILEKLFHARWWDYSTIPLNLNGRISVPTSAAFGGAAILLIEFVLPWIDAKVSAISPTVLNAMVLLEVSVFSMDFALTVTALYNFKALVTAIDSSVRSHIAEAVEQVFEIRSSVTRSAVQRISVFKFSERKAAIAKRLAKIKRVLPRK